MIEVYKKKYQTCLQMLEKLRVENPELKNEILSYAGILDPMAEGIVPVLIGKEENRNRVSFTESGKKYQFEVLVGVSTDTHDLLGLVKDYNDSEIKKSKTISESFLNHERKFTQVVSMFSNKKHNGKPLWEWGRAGVTIPESERKKTDVIIHDINLKDISKLSREKLQGEIISMEHEFDSTFRIEQVSESWNNYFSIVNIDTYLVLEFEIFVSKGFYIRKLVEDVSRRTGIPLTVYSLKRTEIIWN